MGIPMFDLKKLEDILKRTKVPGNMITRGVIGLSRFVKPIEELLTQMKPPNQGWSDEQIRFFLEILAHMDSNSDPSAFRIGEREARISTKLLYDYSGGFIHGIGRSGDIKAPQPKATGGSILNVLTDAMVTFFFKEMGLTNIKGSITLPLSTGMSIMLVIRGLYNQYLSTKEIDSTSEPSNHTPLKDEIIFLRMDHKSPRKGIALSGMKIKIIEGKIGKVILEGIKDDPSKQKFKKFIEKNGLDAVYISPNVVESAITERTFAILSTTTFFPPRAPDYIKDIAKIAKKHNVYHIINNAYGAQNEYLMKLIRSAIDAGRVDAILQSTDKNFLTPVGGAIVSSPFEKNLVSISQAYAGRGSSAPILHLMVSMLSMGLDGYKELVKNQLVNKELLLDLMNKFAESVNEKVLDVNNTVACMLTLNTLREDEISKLGGYLYNLRVTGPRVVNPKKQNFGPSIDNFQHPYLVMNAAIGSRDTDIIGAVNQLKKAFKQIKHT